MTNSKPKFFDQQKRYFLLGTLLLLSISTHALSKVSAPARILENQILAWFAGKKIDTSALSIQINDARLQIPECQENFTLDMTSELGAAAIRTISASCPSVEWYRLIRIRPIKETVTRQRAVKEKEKIDVWVAEHSIKQYEPITRDKLTKQKLVKNKVPTSAIDLASPIKNLYARRVLRRGQIITESDLTRPQKVIVVNSSLAAQNLLEKSDLSIAYRIKDVPHDAVTSLEGIRNLATNRLLHSGDILRKRDLAQAKLIKRGELVMVEAKTNSFQIINEAIAFQDGYFGDQIKLRSVDTKRQINAQVTGKGKAKTLSKQWITK